ncbi:RagB/SusD family nutrient uptake outer membrane protein [uncultured Mucilaginibacter sp.]|uniref:RagB/SusD family nutrient uptake outer membrane protein n=1 Tax=uncultured Mucilaginibacter sp. TaxID=797541 RepID=UPI0025E1F013|nr:RagB/SusD family nutrient uptake outer membrane protein [uncultured Mucilaginibacter sp.]
MKRKNYIYIFLAGIIVMSSCKKQFLVETPPSATPVTSAIVTDYDMSDAVNGMYAAMRSSSLFGRDIPVLGDVFSDNVYVSSTNSGRYLSENNFSMNNLNGEASDIWTQGYFTILQANRIINSSIPTDATNSQLRGEAYTARALTYLEMVNYFGQSYNVSPTALGVPIVTGYTGPGTEPSRNTVSDVYARMIKDLDSAYVLMGTTPISSAYHATNSEYLAKYAAKAIEARVYLYKGDYANALAAALLVIQNGGYTLVPSTGLAAYWANPAALTNKQETIFELALNLASNNGTNGLDYMYAQAGYGDLLCATDLYNLYSTTDARRGLILNGTRGGLQAYIVNKYSNVTNASDKDDIKIIRYAEVLLTAAEAYAQTGDNVNGALYLNMVAKQRDPSFLGYTDVGTALINDILTERRKELAFEGLRWFDLTRTNAVVNRLTTAPQAASTLNVVPVGATYRLMPIPFTELSANPNITQNPGY